MQNFVVDEIYKIRFEMLEKRYKDGNINHEDYVESKDRLEREERLNRLEEQWEEGNIRDQDYFSLKEKLEPSSKNEEENSLTNSQTYPDKETFDLAEERIKRKKHSEKKEWSEPKTVLVFLIGFIVIALFASDCGEQTCDSFTGAERDRCIDSFQGEREFYMDRYP